MFTFGLLVTLSCMCMRVVGSAGTLRCSRHHWFPDSRSHKFNQCPRGLSFPGISKPSQIPPLTENWIMMQGRDYWNGRRPVISAEDRDRAKRLVKILRTVGFVYLLNHSIPENLMVSAFRRSRLFNDLSEEEKVKSFGLDETDQSPMALEEAYLRHAEEQKVKQLEDVEDASVPLPLQEFFSLHQDTIAIPNAPLKNLFPSLDGLRQESCHLAHEVLQMIAIGLDLDDINVFVDVTRGLFNKSVKSMSRLTSVLYDEVKEGQIFNKSVISVAPHIDFSLISFIYQDTVGGLQVLDVNRKGDWVAVDPLPGSVVLLGGSAIRIFSGGVIIPSVHRVEPPRVVELRDGSVRIVKNRPERQSMIHFIVSDDEAWVRPIKHNPLTTKQYFTNIRKHNRFV